MKQDTQSTVRLEARLPPEVIARLKRAAQIQGTLTDLWWPTTTKPLAAPSSKPRFLPLATLLKWHDANAEANLQTHGVSFELAKTVFKDPFAVERVDDREDYGEERYVIIGMAEGHVLLFVAYTEREERIRIISARRVTQHEQDDYFRQNS